MPELERPDGARIHYEVRGEGPLVVLSLRGHAHQLDEEGLRGRVDETLAYSPVEVTLARIESWRADDDALEAARALGDRLLVIWNAGDDWQTGSIERVGQLLPEARLVEVEDGPLSRPDLAAAVLREMT